MVQYLCLFYLILQDLHEEGECRQLEFWAGKGEYIRDLFCTTPKVLKLHENYFGIYKKYWAKKYQRGTHQVATSLGARPIPQGVPPGLVGPLAGLRRPSSTILSVFDLEKSEGSFRDEALPSRGGT